MKTGLISRGIIRVGICVRQNSNKDEQVPVHRTSTENPMGLARVLHLVFYEIWSYHILLSISIHEISICRNAVSSNYTRTRIRQNLIQYNRYLPFLRSLSIRHLFLIKSTSAVSHISSLISLPTFPIHLVYKCVLAGVSFFDGLSWNPPAALPILSLALFFLFFDDAEIEESCSSVETLSGL